MPRIYQQKSTTDCQPISVSLNPGKYLLECWGAQGGAGRLDSELSYPGGRGAYASGILDLKERAPFHLYIGTKGKDGPNNHEDIAPGGWNGGGNGGKDKVSSNVASSGAGGGATDIRLVIAPNGEEATNETSLDSRIIVAAGGSGSVWKTYGAPGGDLTGYKVTALDVESYVKSDTNQEDGKGKGQGENGKEHVDVPSSGAGGGYFGGNAAEGTSSNFFTAVSSSGSSYVSGFPGCETLTIPQASVFNYQLQFPHIVNGIGAIPSIDSDGNGAVKITLLQLCTACAYRKSNILLYVAIFVISTK